MCRQLAADCDNHEGEAETDPVRCRPCRSPGSGKKATTIRRARSAAAHARPTIDRKGGDVGLDGTEKRRGQHLTNGAGAMATEEACCQYCCKIFTAVIYKWESTGGHNCWYSNVKGGITAQGPSTDRRAVHALPPVSAPDYTSHIQW